MFDPLIDTHCHIHDSDYDFLIDEVLKQARWQKIIGMICVGTDLRSSREALEFSLKQKDCYFALGIHPHLATRPLKELEQDFKLLEKMALKYKNHPKFVAIGECGLDYFYHQDQAVLKRQKALLVLQLKLAQTLNLPLIFHVRSAFEDFWPIYSQFVSLGVLHSFSDQPHHVKTALKYPLYFGLNGIMTFSKIENQLKAATLIPLSKLMLETDAPYLTPAPFRGKVNKPEYLRHICQFLADLRGEKVQTLAQTTTKNAQKLFSI